LLDVVAVFAGLGQDVVALEGTLRGKVLESEGFPYVVVLLEVESQLELAVGHVDVLQLVS